MPSSPEVRRYRWSRIAPELAARLRVAAEGCHLSRITVDPEIFGGKSILRGRRLAVEHVLGMLAAGDDVDTILGGYPWIEREDVLACQAYARRLCREEACTVLIVVVQK